MCAVKLVINGYRCIVNVIISLLLIILERFGISRFILLCLPVSLFVPYVLDSVPLQCYFLYCHVIKTGVIGKLCKFCIVKISQFVKSVLNEDSFFLFYLFIFFFFLV
jgi:hypothetical protein